MPLVQGVTEHAALVAELRNVLDRLLVEATLTLAVRRARSFSRRMPQPLMSAPYLASATL
jgi:hypothetical protein